MTTDLLKPELSFLNNMDLPHKNAWAPFSNYTLQLHMDFHGFKWLISFCACSFQISIIMFIFLYRLTGGDDHADQRGKACLKCFCDTFDSDRCMNSLTRRWMSICSRSMVYRRLQYVCEQIWICRAHLLTDCCHEIFESYFKTYRMWLNTMMEFSQGSRVLF